MGRRPRSLMKTGPFAVAFVARCGSFSNPCWISCDGHARLLFGSAHTLSAETGYFEGKDTISGWVQRAWVGPGAHAVGSEKPGARRSAAAVVNLPKTRRRQPGEGEDLPAMGVAESWRLMPACSTTGKRLGRVVEQNAGLVGAKAKALDDGADAGMEVESR